MTIYLSRDVVRQCINLCSLMNDLTSTKVLTSFVAVEHSSNIGLGSIIDGFNIEQDAHVFRCGGAFN